MRQHDVQPNSQGAHFLRAPVGCLHDARTAAGADKQLISRRSRVAVARHQARKQPRLVVIPSIANMPLGQSQRGFIVAFFSQLKRCIGLLGRGKAGAAEHHNRVFNALGLLVDFGLKHFQLDAQAAGFTAQQKLRVGKSEPVGIGPQRRAVGGLEMQFSPGIGQTVFGEVLGLFHKSAVSIRRATGYFET